MPEIDRFLKEMNTEAEKILKSSRRVCSIPDHFRGQQGVLGTVMEFVVLVPLKSLLF